MTAWLNKNWQLLLLWLWFLSAATLGMLLLEYFDRSRGIPVDFGDRGVMWFVSFALAVIVWQFWFMLRQSFASPAQLKDFSDD